MSLLERRDLVRLGRDARQWFLAEERRRVIGLVVFSVAASIFVSLLATVIVGLVSSRRAASPGEPASREGLGEPLAAVATPAGVPVMEARAATSSVEALVEA